MAYPAEPTTIDADFRVLDDQAEGEGDATDAFDKIVNINSRRPTDASNPDNWLSTVANPDTNLAELAIVVAPTAYLWDLAYRQQKGMAGQAVYAAVGAAVGVVALHIARARGWVK